MFYFLSFSVFALGQNNTSVQCLNLTPSQQNDVSIVYSYDQAVDLYNAIVYQHNLEDSEHKVAARTDWNCIYINSSEQLAALEINSDTVVILGSDVELHQPVKNGAHHVLFSGVPKDDGDIPQIHIHSRAYLSFCQDCTKDDSALLLMHKIRLAHSSSLQTEPIAA